MANPDLYIIADHKYQRLGAVSWGDKDGTPVKSAARIVHVGNGLMYHMLYHVNTVYNLEYDNAADTNVGGYLQRSTDYGETWTSIANPPASVSTAFLTPKQFGVKAFDVDTGGRLWGLFTWGGTNVTPAGNAPGSILGTELVYYSDDQGTTWVNSTGLPSDHGASDIACHPSDSNLIALYANAGNAFSDGGTKISYNRGVTWATTLEGGTDTAWVTYQPPPQIVWTENSALILLEAGNGLWRSTNYGASWTNVQGFGAGGTYSGQLLRCRAAGPYFAFRQGTALYRSVDDGATWESIAFPTGTGTVVPSGICYDSINDALVFVGEDVLIDLTRNPVCYSLANATSVAHGSPVWTALASPTAATAGFQYRWGNVVFLGANPTSGGGGGGGNTGAILMEPFSRTFIDRFPRDLTADRKPEKAPRERMPAIERTPERLRPG